MLGTVRTPRRAPTAKRGGKAPGSPCPVPATKSRPCCQKYSPLSLTAASPSSSSPVAGPIAGARDAPGEGCPWDRRHKAVPALHPETGTGSAEPGRILRPTSPLQLFCRALQTLPCEPGAVPAVPIPPAARRDRAQGDGEQVRGLVRAGAGAAGAAPVAAGLRVSVNRFFRLSEFSHSRLKLKG